MDDSLLYNGFKNIYFSTYTTKLSCIYWSHIRLRSLLFTIFIVENALSIMALCVCVCVRERERERRLRREGGSYFPWRFWCNGVEPRLGEESEEIMSNKTLDLF
ncbi:hypothetical protein RHMOL_Rhmol01G0353200 [Rhododendron molle]|uniref:Uncharacterized protein n=1 Tax=Rhododendron molle TaxID=49168 RepID=A0ACC0QAE7_RHOML|nr:hypothetical protein RHMOL_Rhmol01G0353200 [Rhododendron molle]